VATTPASLAAKAATTRVPIVFAAVVDPLGVGLVASLAKPGGNITGVTNIVAEFTGKRLELLKELVPSASRIAVLVNPDDANATPQIREAEAAARVLGIELHPILHVRADGDAAKAVSEAASARADAALRMADPTIYRLQRETADAAVKYRLPIIFPFRENVVEGGLLSYGTNLPAQFAQAARLVAKILRGAKSAELPVEQAATFELVINMKTAKTLGLSVPSVLLARADEVIE
jgi:putative ABC transport system substrate-binding protein